MTTWLALGVLMLVSCSKASIFSNSLEDKIKEGKKNITGIASIVDQKAGEVSQEMNKISLNFFTAVNKSMIEGERIYNISAQKVDKIIIANFEKAIALNNRTRVSLYLLETMENTKGELDGRYENLRGKLTGVLKQKSNELLKLRNLLDFTQTYSTGFYEGLKANMTNCKDERCIARLIQTANRKNETLTGTFTRYIKEISYIGDELEDGHRKCLRDAQKEFGEVMKKFDNEMEYIP